MSSTPRTIDATGIEGSAPVTTDLRKIDRWVEQAALVMMPTGMIFIVLGWMGASRTPLMFEQIPYMISGGLLGLGLMIGGGLLYVGGWIARVGHMLRGEQPASTGIVRALEGLSLVGGGGDALAPDAWVRTPSGSMFHTADCAVVSGRTDVVEVSQEQSTKYKPCGMCNPAEASVA